MKKTLCLILASMLGASAFGNLMMQIISTHNGPAVVIDGVTYYLPAYAVTEPTTNYPDGFADFEFVANTTNVSALAPQIAEWTRQNQPGDTMALTAENLNQTNTLFMFSDDGSDVYAGDILVLDDRQCAVTLPDGLSSNTFYLMWPYNADGFGEPVGINQADLWWCNSSVATGSMFRVFGQNLELDGTSHLYIKELDTWLSTTNCDPYMAQYTLPSSATAGTYTVYAHNGRGGRYGWSTSFSIKVWDGYQFSDDANTWIDVTDYGVVGDGVTENNAALASVWAAAKDSAWPTIYFPEGDYLIGGTSGVVFGGGTSKGLRIIGDGTNSMIRCKTVGYYTESLKLQKHNTILKDIAFSREDTGLGTTYSKALNIYQSLTNFVCDGVLFTDQYTTGDETARNILQLDKISHVTFTNCYFYLARQIDPTGDDYVYDTCTFRGVNDCGGFGAGASGNGMALINSTNDSLDNSDTACGDGWGRGRWFVSGINYGSVNWYIGGNVNTNAQPRKATPRMWAYPTAVDGYSALDATYYTQRVYFASLADCERDDITHVEMEYVPGTIHEFSVINFDRSRNFIDLKYEKWVQDNNKDYAPSAASTNWLTGLKDYNDYNGGEQFMKEGGISKYRGLVSSATSNTVTFADLSSKVPTLLSGMSAVIVSGKGLGQSRLVTGIAGETASLEKSWSVIPDSTSAIVFGRFASQWAVYNNRLFSNLSQFTTQKCASAGVQFSSGGGAYQIIIDGNTFVGQYIGLALDMSDYAGGYGYSMTTNVVNPWYFGHVQGNLFQGIERDFLDGTISYPAGNANEFFADDTLMLGLVYRGNTSKESKNSVFYTKQLTAAYSNSKNHLNMTIFDNNIAQNFTELSYATKARENDVLVGNTFLGNGASKGWELVDNSVALQGNTFTGFSANYWGVLPGAVLQIPQGTILLSESSKTIELYNVGTTGLTWTATDNAAWLDVTASGSIAAESSGTMTLTRVGSTTNGATASVSVVAGGTTNTFTVVYGDELGTP